MLYHASRTANIDHLMPFVSNHGIPQVYFSSKRENVLVYLSNAVEKYCREIGFVYDGPWYKWASYGFDQNGRIQLEEYYPNALYETYKGISGYIYCVDASERIVPLQGIPDAYVSSEAVQVVSSEYVKDAYEAIIEAEQHQLISIVRYAQLSDNQLRWIADITLKEYSASEDHPEYRYFLKGKFSGLWDCV